MDDNAPNLWSLADLAPDTPAEKLAEELASHFTEITNQSKALEAQEVPCSNVPDVLILQYLKENVARRIREYKKPNSSVPGDVPKSLINPLANQLSVPLTAIFNMCLAQTKWPLV